MKFIELAEVSLSESIENVSVLINPHFIDWIRWNAGSRKTVISVGDASLTVDQTPAEIMAMIREAEADPDHHSPAPDADARKRIAELEAEIAALRIRAEQAESALEEAREEVPALDEIRVLKTARKILRDDSLTNTDTYYGGLCDAAVDVMSRCLAASGFNALVIPYHVK